MSDPFFLLFSRHTLQKRAKDIVSRTTSRTANRIDKTLNICYAYLVVESTFSFQHSEVIVLTLMEVEHVGFYMEVQELEYILVVEEVEALQHIVAVVENKVGVQKLEYILAVVKKMEVEKLEQIAVVENEEHVEVILLIVEEVVDNKRKVYILPEEELHGDNDDGD